MLCPALRNSLVRVNCCLTAERSSRVWSMVLTVPGTPCSRARARGQSERSSHEKQRYGRTSVGVLRSTFLLDDHGRVERAWHNVTADGHAASVLSQLKP
jgi:hypothetical protein